MPGRPKKPSEKDTASAEPPPKKRRGPRGGETTITTGGLVRKSLFITLDEEYALRKLAFEENVSESSLVRRALRTFLGLPPEDGDGASSKK